MLNPVELNVFVMAAETENFSLTARRLGITQPTVSAQIRALEDRLGMDLFERTGRTVALTEAGKALVPLARDILHRCVRIEETMASLQGDILGRLDIGCTTASGKYVLPRILAGLRLKHPRVEIVCKVTNRREALEMLRTGAVQVAITSLLEPARDLEYQLFATDRIVLITPRDHPWAGRTKPVGLRELQTGRFIWREEGSGTREAVEEVLGSHGLAIDDLPRVMELGNSEAIRVAVAEGLGVAFVSALVAAEAGPDDVAVVPVRGLSPERPLYMVRDTARPATRAQIAFWDLAFSDEMEAVRRRVSDPEGLPA